MNLPFFASDPKMKRDRNVVFIAAFIFKDVLVCHLLKSHSQVSILPAIYLPPVSESLTTLGARSLNVVRPSVLS